MVQDSGRTGPGTGAATETDRPDSTRVSAQVEGNRESCVKTHPAWHESCSTRGMRLPKRGLFILLLLPLLLSPAFAQRGGVRGGAGGGYYGGRGFYGGRGYFYGGRYWGPGVYFGWGYPYYWDYPYYWSYPYWAYPDYSYPYYYGYNPYPYGSYPAYPPPPVTRPAPQGQNQTAPPPKPPDDPPPATAQDIGLWEPGLGDLLSDADVRQQLGVTAAQAAKIDRQQSDFVKTQIRNTAQLQIERMELDDLVFAEKPDRSAIDSKLQEIGAAQAAPAKSDIDTFLAAQEALTPVQRQKLQRMMTAQSEPAAENKAARPGA